MFSFKNNVNIKDVTEEQDPIQLSNESLLFLFIYLLKQNQMCPAINSG